MFNTYSKTNFGVQEPRIKGEITRIVLITKINAEQADRKEFFPRSFSGIMEWFPQFQGWNAHQKDPICFFLFSLVSDTLCEIGLK